MKKNKKTKRDKKKLSTKRHTMPTKIDWKLQRNKNDHEQKQNYHRDTKCPQRDKNLIQRLKENKRKEKHRQSLVKISRMKRHKTATQMMLMCCFVSLSLCTFWEYVKGVGGFYMFPGAYFCIIGALPCKLFGVTISIFIYINFMWEYLMLFIFCHFLTV